MAAVVCPVSGCDAAHQLTCITVSGTNSAAGAFNRRTGREFSCASLQAQCRQPRLPDTHPNTSSRPQATPSSEKRDIPKAALEHGDLGANSVLVACVALYLAQKGRSFFPDRASVADFADASACSAYTA